MTGSQIGPFELRERLGRGGMGEVWRATHRDGEAVALKWLLGEGVRHDDFRREARAAAAMDHPGVVRVYDYGEVRAGDTVALPTGTPYLVMELLEGGTLGERMPTGWSQLRRVLLAILDALAHAHARGVVHRDIKPGNVLRGGRFGGWKLVDFGLAHTSGEIEGRATGTLLYMAPEQHTARWRDFGPQTDLWAVGCLGWEMACGRPPFDASRPEALRQAILQRDPPPLQPLFPVPDGFEGWVTTLLERDPAARCDRAAEAAAALLALGDAPDDAVVARPIPSSASSSGAALTFAWDGPTDEPPVTSGGAGRFPTPGPPSDWRPVGEVPHLPPSALGIGLYRLRRAPVAGRLAERDRLWDVLLRIEDGGPSEGVLVEGPLGAGTSRLAEWLCVRAHELGVATVLRASGDLRHTLHPLWRTWGLGEAEARAAIVRRLQEIGSDAVGIDALVGWLVGEGPPSPDTVAVLARVLRDEGRRRTVVVWIDDAAGEADALALCAASLGDDARVLWLLSASEGGEPAPAGGRLDALRPRLDSLTLGPLPVAERSLVVRSVLPLDPELALVVEHRSEGVPGFVVQLVGDWVARDLLAPGPHGYRLVCDALDALPADLAEIESRRVAPVQRRWPDAIAAAAVLGKQVDRGAWRALVPDAPHRDVEERLVRDGLAVPGPHGWHWSHTVAREVALQRARDDGSAARWHLRAAALPIVARDPALRGRHLAAGGAWAACLDPLLEAAKRATLRGHRDEAGMLLAERDRAVEALGLGDDPRVAEGLAWRAWLLSSRAEYDASHDLNARAEAIAAAHDAWDVLGCCAYTTATNAQGQGRLQEAIDGFARSAEMYQRAGNALDRENALLAHARMLAYVDPPTAEEALAHLADTSTHGTVSAIARRVLAYRLTARGALDEAERHLQQALRWFEDHGTPRHVAASLSILGSIATERGDHERAVVLHDQAIRALADARAEDRATHELNKGIALLMAGRPEQALDLAAAAGVQLRRSGSHRIELGAEAAAGAAAARIGRWDRVAGHLARVDELVGVVQHSEPEIVRLLELVEEAARPERPDLADEARRQADRHAGAGGR